MKHHEKNKTQKKCSSTLRKKVQYQKSAMLKKAQMKRVQHEEIATRNECNTKKVQQEMSAT